MGAQSAGGSKKQLDDATFRGGAFTTLVMCIYKATSKSTADRMMAAYDWMLVASQLKPNWGYDRPFTQQRVVNYEPVKVPEIYNSFSVVAVAKTIPTHRLNGRPYS